MPTSNLAVWPDILHAVHEVPHRTVLDVGPGHGKAAVLLREYLNEPPERIDAVEAWLAYTVRFGLNRLYDRLYVGDVAEDTWTRMDGTEQEVPAGDALAGYELVLMADVIEHIELETAFRLLDRIPGRVVICTPVEFFHNDPEGVHPPTEQHISHWTQDHWDELAATRPLEVCYQNLGGWIVRLGPLAGAEG